MKKIFLITFAIVYVFSNCFSQQINYISLDPSNPITFKETFIVYKGDTIILGPKAFFIDGQFIDEEAKKYPFVFNSVNKAAEHLTAGTEQSPMVLYIAPYVYWIDDPDDPEIRIPERGSTPYGLIIDCSWLKFYGLTEKAENVVLACNRGQTIGAQGNFTMFLLLGDGIISENITFGNYCNVDLEFPLNPELNREKRASAIVQAQLIHCNGDKIVARNTRFISRLNLCPFVGAKRILFDNCHFECTDDALCGTGVYLNSTFDFYSSKPFYRTVGTGAVFLNCNINSLTRGNQYFTKANGQLAIIDTRINTETAAYFGWRDTPPLEMRNYQYNFTVNGNPILISKNDSFSTIEMTNKPILNAYRFEYNNEAIYNTYNLLKGEDDWDPMEIKKLVLTAEKESGKKFTNIPVQLIISPADINLETGKDSTLISAKLFRFGNYEFKPDKINWKVAPEFESILKLEIIENGEKCIVIPTNKNDETTQAVVVASTITGLEAASVIHVAPAMLNPPQFIIKPKITNTNEGKLKVNYKLDMEFEDQSLVNWYRCTDNHGNNPVEIAVSRFNKPLLEYNLSHADIGYFIKVSVSPKHIRCNEGDPVSYVMEGAITEKDVKVEAYTFYENFKNHSTKNQPEMIPGFWTFRHFETEENPDQKVYSKENNAWYYGKGSDGAANDTGLLQTGRSATLFYTPLKKAYGDMKAELTVAPFKSAGQGFSIANLYMDVLIKFDTETMTGYALRFIRTTKYGNAVDSYFVKYKNGEVFQISEPVTTSCYRTPCNITLEVKNNKIYAHAFTSSNYYSAHYDKNVLPEVNIETEIIPNAFGGFGIQYNGGAKAIIKKVLIIW